MLLILYNSEFRVQFTADKDKLIHISQYFRALLDGQFAESNTETVKIQTRHPVILYILLQSILSTTPNPTESNIFQLKYNSLKYKIDPCIIGRTLEQDVYYILNGLVYKYCREQRQSELIYWNTKIDEVNCDSLYCWPDLNILYVGTDYV